MFTVSYPIDTAFSLKASAGVQVNWLIPKSHSCPTVMWQNKHHSNSAVLLSFPKDNIKLLAHKPAHVHPKHLSSLEAKFLHFLLTGLLMLFLSSSITHCPHFSIRAHLHFSNRHQQCPENSSFVIT